MVEAFLGLLGFLVFGLLWLAHQDWFDLLPRQVTRSISGIAFLVLVGRFIDPEGNLIGVAWPRIAIGRHGCRRLMCWCCSDSSSRVCRAVR